MPFNWLLSAWERGPRHWLSCPDMALAPAPERGPPPLRPSPRTRQGPGADVSEKNSSFTSRSGPSAGAGSCLDVTLPRCLRSRPGPQPGWRLWRLSQDPAGALVGSACGPGPAALPRPRPSPQQVRRRLGCRTCLVPDSCDSCRAGSSRSPGLAQAPSYCCSKQTFCPGPPHVQETGSKFSDRGWRSRLHSSSPASLRAQRAPGCLRAGWRRPSPSAGCCIWGAACPAPEPLGLGASAEPR